MEGFQSFEIRGHANYAEYGSDIVCAGISTAVIVTINLIDRFTKKYHFFQDEEKGIVTFSFDMLQEETSECRKVVQEALDNLVETLQEMQNQYPKNLSINIEK